MNKRHNQKMRRALFLHLLTVAILALAMVPDAGAQPPHGLHPGYIDLTVNGLPDEEHVADGPERGAVPVLAGQVAALALAACFVAGRAACRVI